MKRCSCCEWIPILPMPVWPLAWQCSLGQNTVVGSMTLLLAMRGNIATRSMSGPPFALQLHRTTVWCGATHEFIWVGLRAGGSTMTVQEFTNPSAIAGLGMVATEPIWNHIRNYGWRASLHL